MNLYANGSAYLQLIYWGKLGFASVRLEERKRRVAYPAYYAVDGMYRDDVACRIRNIYSHRDS